MKVTLRRIEYGSNYTVGRLYIESLFECFTLEDKVRDKGVKIFGETAIPAGIYKVTIDFSEHFGKDLPHILDVPMFEGIRIHSGNTDLDTEGCLLVGTGWGGGDNISNSRVAFSHLYDQLLSAIDKKEEITITIEDTK